MIEGESAARAAAAGHLRGGPEGRRAPDGQHELEGQQAAFFKHASDAQLDWVSPLAKWAVENADVSIAVMASTNTRELSQVAARAADAAPGGDARADGQVMERAAEGSYRWA